MSDSIAARPRLYRSLRWRLVLPTALLLVSALAIQGGVSVVDEIKLVQRLQREQGMSLAEAIGAAGTDALLRRDIEQLEALVLRQAGHHAVRAIQLFDAERRMLVDVGRGDQGPAVRYGYDAPAFPQGHDGMESAPGASITPFSMPADTILWQTVEGDEGSALGWIRLTLDAAVARELVTSLWQRSIAITLTAVLLVIGGIALVTRGPLAALQRASAFSARLASSRGARTEPYAPVAEIDTLLLALNRASFDLAAQDAALRASTRFLESLTETLGEGVYATDASGHCVFVNPEALRVTGRHREDVIGADACAIFHQPDTGGEGCRGVCTPVRALASGERFRSEHARFRRADGSTFPARIIATPFEEGGARRGSVVVFSDITEQRQAQEAMEAARRAAEEANLARSRFLSMVSHELRTPMNAILGMSQLALMKTSEPAVQRNLQTINEAGKALLALLENLIQYSAAEGASGGEELQRFELDGLLESVMARLRPLATKKGLGFSCSSDEDVPSDLVGDAKSIERALSLYVDNALKFTSAGRIELKVRLAPAVAGGLWLRFIVEDTGIGIEPERQAALFQPFQQGDMSLTRRYGGLGIGLALVRQLVERMGGRVGVESRNGEGSRFWFEVPVGVAHDAALA